MKRYVREAIEVLEALGFEREDDAFGRTDRRIYRHSYEPATRLTVYSGATEAACSAVRAKAEQIAGLGTSKSARAAVNERKKAKRAKRSRERGALRRIEEARREATEAAARELRAIRAQENAERNQREIQSLMMPGRGH